MKPQKQGAGAPTPTLNSQTATKLYHSATITNTARPFPVEVLPGAIGTFVAETAAAIGCDASFVALPILACLARAIGNKRTIRLKRTWEEPAILWCVIVGKSGTHKSPARKAATAVLKRKQQAALAEYEEALIRWQQEFAEYQRALAHWQRSKKSDEPPPREPKVPVCQRYIVCDITIEALAERLADQFDPVLVDRDELAGWVDGMAEYKGGKGSDTSHWLAMWSADALTVDRKTGARKMIHVPRAAVSIVGGIQPGVLRRAIGKEHRQDGLCARFLLAMPIPQPVKWTEATVSPQTEVALAKVFDRLLAMEPASDKEGNPVPIAIPLTPEAKVKWVAYYDRHRSEQIDLDEDLAAAWSKLEAYTARFALIFQFCANAAGEANDDAVDDESIKAAIILSDWFGNEARRVYGVMAETEQEREQRELVERIRRKGGSVTARDLMRCSRHFPLSKDAEAALDSLAKAGMGKWQHVPPGPTGGKPTGRFTLVDAADVDDTPTKSHENDGYVNVNGVSSGNGHADEDTINQLLAEAGDENEIDSRAAS